MHLGDHTIYEAVDSNVQGDERMARQPLHEPACQGRRPLLPCVRPPLPLYPKPETQLELMVTFRDSIQVFNLVLALATLGKLPTDGPGWILATILQYVPLFTFTPRFVISMRELYAQDGKGRAVGGVDTAFGLSAISSRGAVETAMVFAEAGQEQNGGLEDAEEMPMEDGVIREESRDAGVV